MVALGSAPSLPVRRADAAPARLGPRSPDQYSDFLALKNDLSTAQLMVYQSRSHEAEATLQQLIPRIECAAARYGSLMVAKLVELHLLSAEARSLSGLVGHSLGQDETAQVQMARATEEFQEWLPLVEWQSSYTLGSYALALDAVGRYEQAIAVLEKAVAQGCVSASALLLLARYREAQGDLGAAVGLCRQSVDMAPGYLDSYLMLARILEAQGNPMDAYVSYRQVVNLLWADGRLDEALGLAQRIRELYPDDVDGLVVLGELLRANDEADKALEILNDALRVEPCNNQVLASRGAVLVALGHHEDALRSLDDALSFDPTNAWALTVKGDTLCALGRFDEALDVLERALALKGQDAGVLAAKGQVLHRIGRTNEAATIFQHAVEAAPTWAWVQIELGAVLFDAARFEEALETAERALELHPDDPQALHLKISVLGALDQYDQALQVLGNALERNPDDTHLLWLEGNVLHQLGRNEDALALFNRLSLLEPENAAVLGMRGLVLASMGQQRKAAGVLYKAAKFESSPAWVFVELGSLLINLDLNHQALKSFEHALEREPENAVAWRGTGEALRLLDRHEEALVALDKSLALEPDSILALGTKGQVLKVLGRNTEAKEAFRQAITLKPEWSWLHAELGSMLGYESVLQVLNTLLEKEPRNPSALSAKGEVLRLLGRLWEALDVLKQAMDLAPEDAFALATQGQVLRALKENDAAGNALVRAVRINPKMSWAYNELSALDRHQEALDVLHMALESSPEDWQLHNLIGELLSDIGEFELAAEAHTVAIGLSRDESTSYSDLGWALLNLDRGADALRAYRNALRCGSSDRNGLWVRRGLADAYMITDDLKIGRRLYCDLIQKIERSVPDRDSHILSLLGWCHYQLGHFDGSCYQKALQCYSDALAQAPGDVLPTQFDLALVLLCMDRESAARQEYQWGLKLARERSELRQRGLLLVALQDLREAEQIRSQVQPGLGATTLLSVRKQLEDRLQEINAAVEDGREAQQTRSLAQPMSEPAGLEDRRQRLEDHSREIDSVEQSRKTEGATQLSRSAQ